MADSSTGDNRPPDLAQRATDVSTIGLAEAIGQPNAEALAQQRNVMAVNGSGWIARMPTHGPLGGLAADGRARDGTPTLKGRGREHVAPVDGAIMQRAVGPRFVHVKVDA